jgi:hypothetical protein
MSRLMKAVPLVVLWALIIAVPSVWANWVQNGVALCTATGDQRDPQIIADGTGGAIVTWQHCPFLTCFDTVKGGGLCEADLCSTFGCRHQRSSRSEL